MLGGGAGAAKRPATENKSIELSLADDVRFLVYLFRPAGEKDTQKKYPAAAG
jgi:hypothetical protein